MCILVGRVKSNVRITIYLEILLDEKKNGSDTSRRVTILLIVT